MKSMINSLKYDEDCATSRGKGRKERVLGCIVPEFAFCEGSRKIVVTQLNFFSAENILSIARLVQSHLHPYVFLLWFIPQITSHRLKFWFDFITASSNFSRTEIPSISEVDPTKVSNQCGLPTTFWWLVADNTLLLNTRLLQYQNCVITVIIAIIYTMIWSSPFHILDDTKTWWWV